MVRFSEAPDGSGSAAAPIWPPPHGPLTGDVVELVPLRAEHEQPLFEASEGQAELWRWLRGTPPDRQEFAAYFAQALDASAAGSEQPYCTVLRAGGRPVGTTRFLAIRPEHRSVEIGGTWPAPSSWRTGANVEAKLLMLTRAFEEIGAQRVELKTDARNARSRAAMTALPAQFEGIHRRHMITPYGPRDSAYFSVIAPEWPDVKANLRRRLAQR